LTLAAIPWLSILAQTRPPGLTGGGYASPVPIPAAPGQVLTLFAAGMGGSLSGPVRAAPGPLPGTLAGISVNLRQGSDRPVPILEVRPVSTCPRSGELVAPGTCGVIAAITVQIPYELIPFCPLCLRPVDPPALLTVSEGGRAGAALELSPLADQIHILTSCDVLLDAAELQPVNLSGLPCPKMVTHADGRVVTAANPARGGEELVAYAFGLGLTNPSASTGQPVERALPTIDPIGLMFDYTPNALATKPPPRSAVTSPATPPLPIPRFSGLTPRFVGLYQVNFAAPAVPPGTPPCSSPGRFGGVIESNLTVSIGGNYSFDGAGICMAVSLEN
jgi:uncharacterized protein (TIGR03437 family)